MQSPAGARYAIVASCWNPHVVDALVAGARKELIAHEVTEEAIDLVKVPGAWDIPAAVARLVQRDYAALLAFGCVVRGDTRHYEHVADCCAQGLMQLATSHALPVLNGVLAVERLADAETRALAGNKGGEVAVAAIEMANLWRRL